ncbi:MAG: VWA domain-containing protein [Puniceicoccaceae bacterium]|nr:MAG: VWA domain-containing protein [Puniceicoccaceae bacterium]
MGLDTPLSGPLLVLIALALAAGVVLQVRRVRGLLRPGLVVGLALLRTTAFLAVLLLILNPFTRQTEPDPEGFRLAVLVDASGSMDARDLEGGAVTRIDRVNRWLADLQGPPFGPLVERGYRMEFHRFSEHLHPLPSGEPLRPLPGGTAIGDVLRELIDRPEGGGVPALGGVLLISDGRENRGQPMLEAGRSYRRRGIPVSTVLVGGDHPARAAVVSFARHRLEGRRDEPLELPLRAENPGDRPVTLELRLLDESGLLVDERVTLAAGERRSLDLSTTPRREGIRALRLEVRDVAAPAETPPAVDLALADVRPPDQFRVLYLAGALHPEHRFLLQVAGDAEEIALESLVRTGPENRFSAVDPAMDDYLEGHGFPEARPFYDGYDAILADTRALAELSEEARGHVLGFVDRRGGGLLVFGPPELLPEELAPLLPARSFDTVRLVRPQPLEVAPAPVFSPALGSRLFSPPAPFLPEDYGAWLAEDLKRAARPALMMPDGRPLLSVLAYGAGRTAYLGSLHTWTWRLDSDAGLEQHRLFWTHLLSWLAIGGKDRIESPAHGARVTLDELERLELDVLGADFRPSSEARISGLLTTPSGDVREVALLPSFRRPGRYSTGFAAEEAGLHRVAYEITFPDGETLRQETQFVVGHETLETRDLSADPAALRDLARLTGGIFIDGARTPDFSAIPLSEEIPMIESRRHWVDQRLLLPLFFLPLLLEWWLRRSVGLK